MPVAARHDECIPAQTALKPGLDDGAQVSGHECNHPDAIGGDQGLQGPGDRPANQGADAELGQAQCFLQRGIMRQLFLDFADDPTGLALDDTDFLRRVKERCDALVQIGKCCFHGLFSIPIKREA
jgi:hypothetical protein